MHISSRWCWQIRGLKKKHFSLYFPFIGFLWRKNFLSKFFLFLKDNQKNSWISSQRLESSSSFLCHRFKGIFLNSLSLLILCRITCKATRVSTYLPLVCSAGCRVSVLFGARVSYGWAAALAVNGIGHLQMGTEPGCLCQVVFLNVGESCLFFVLISLCSAKDRCYS